MDVIQALKKDKYRILIAFIGLTCFPFCFCIEEYQREIFLGPRNFNPHPYEHHLSRIADPGPVLFPSDDEASDSQVSNKYNIITIDQARSKYPVDSHPYAKVAQKVKYLISRNKKYSSRENQIDTEVYDALAEQGSKVLTYPPEELQNYDRSLSQQKKNYAFAYKVLDKSTGDDFSHQQIRSSKATNGEYRVKLPDGRIQIVSYKADKDGYKADVKYEVDPDANVQGPPLAPAPHQYVPQHVDVQRVPVRELGSRTRPKIINTYDYVAEEKHQQLFSPIKGQNVVLLDQVGPTQIPVNYVDVNVAPNPTPTAYLLGSPVNHQIKDPHHYPNVQIYTSNARDHLRGSYVSTTPAPPSYEREVIRYTSTPVPPAGDSHVSAHVISNGDHGLYNPNLVDVYAPTGRGSNSRKLYKNVISTAAPSQSIEDQRHMALAGENELPEGIYIVGKQGKR